jgi:pSer/pThr/pTyr-binding forkhead associated (FHA) protein
VRFRPKIRPPLALLHVCDDGETSAETVRIRHWPFVIGREQGDIQIRHDRQISSRHAQIIIKEIANGFEFFLQDLGSRNGTYVRATQIVLKPEQVIMIGNCKFDGRNLDLDPLDGDPLDEKPFDLVPFGVESPDAPPASVNATICDHRLMQTRPEKGLNELTPRLHQIGEDGSGQDFDVNPDGVYIGSNPNECSLVLQDRLVSPRHARIYRDDLGRWCIDDLNSLNGVWLKVSEARLRRGGQFQCGEQRFRIEIP